MQKKIVWQWELIENSPNGNTQVYRAKVIGGWVLWTVLQDAKLKMLSTSQIFIADRDHEWVVQAPFVEPPAPAPTVKAADFDPK
jgi:hypothetical protein